MKQPLSLHGKLLAALCLLMAICSFSPTALHAQKEVYIPNSMRGSNFDDPNSEWCWERSKQSDDFVIFWQKGFGKDPSTATGGSGDSFNYRVNVDAVLAVAEDAFNLYADTLGFVTRGASKTDKYKMVIRLYFQKEWLATGSGEDGMIGVLNLNPSTVQPAGHTVAHEVGHCFQYQTQCDNNNSQTGFNYGYGANGSGGNCWWEQCAQWQGFELFPNEIFTNYRFSEYLNNHHRHLIHESPRYANYFIQWYWTYKHGRDFIGRMWKQAKYLEDPIEAYKRMNGNMSQPEFNNDIHEGNARLATWDVPALRELGESYLSSRKQTAMKQVNDSTWKITAAQCPENYGYNVIKLNVPEGGKTVKACFEALLPDGTEFRRMNTKGLTSSGKEITVSNLRLGHRYSFVALKNDGTRIYSEVGETKYATRQDTVEFECPEDCAQLLLVVTGAPNAHWHHPWDDNVANDEQWPYQVAFEGTNLLGYYTEGDLANPHNDTIYFRVERDPSMGYTATEVAAPISRVCSALGLTYQQIQSMIGNGIHFLGVMPSGSSTITQTATYGFWFSKDGRVVQYSNAAAYSFVEMRNNDLIFQIGHYPNRAKRGESADNRVRLSYKKDGKTYTVDFVFHIVFPYPDGIEEIPGEDAAGTLTATVEGDRLVLSRPCAQVFVIGTGGEIVAEGTQTGSIDLSGLQTGYYVVKADGISTKFYKP